MDWTLILVVCLILAAITGHLALPSLTTLLYVLLTVAVVACVAQLLRTGFRR